LLTYLQYNAKAYTNTKPVPTFLFIF